MENKKVKIAVLLTCFNRRDKTIESLKAFMIAVNEVPDAEFSFFLVDDGCTDNTAEAVNKEFPNINTIKAKGNLFWNRGMILAWKEAAKYDHDFYLWLNDDTIVESNGLSILWNDSVFLNHNCIVCGVCKSEGGTNITYSGYKLDTRERMEPIGSPLECGFFNGNLVLIPDSIFKAVGFLDTTFHHSLGDLDYSLRAKKAGYKSFISSAVVAVCSRHNEQPKWCDPKYSIKQRLNFFKNPLSKNPKEVFIFEKRHVGVIKAIYSSFNIYLRLFFPGIINTVKSKVD